MVLAFSDMMQLIGGVTLPCIGASSVVKDVRAVFLAQKVFDIQFLYILRANGAGR